MIVSLPMYPVHRAAVDAFFRAIADRLRSRGVVDVSHGLDWPDDLVKHWRRPDLLLSQACGYPLATQLRGAVRTLGAFAYVAPGCSGIRYRSLIIARADDPATTVAAFRGRRAAFNGPDSQSGYNCFRAAIAPFSQGGRFFSDVVPTGSHAASMRAVADGLADLATIDCVSFAQIGSVEPDLAAGLKVIGETASAPGLPLVTRGTATDAEVAILRDALCYAATDPSLVDIRRDLLIGGFESIEFAAYDEILAMERAAVEAGYPRLA